MHHRSGSRFFFQEWSFRFLFLLIIVSALAQTGPVRAAVFNVDRGDDDASAISCDDGAPNDCSLRGAIISANGLSEASTINVPAGHYVLTQGVPCVFKTTQFGTHGLPSTTALCIAGPITLIGDGAATTIIDGGQLGRVLLVANNGPVEIRNVTIRNGIQRGGGLFGGGGGINAGGALTVIDSVIADNAADGGGGGIYNSGTLTLLRSSVARNLSSVNDGGGLFNYQSIATIIDSAISENTTTGNNGGGIFNFWSRVTLTGSTVDGNASGTLGGGIFNTGIDSTLFITNTTISGNKNHWSLGGGIYNGFRSIVQLQNVTIANNAAGVGSPSGIGGGIANTDLGVITLKNTLIAGNTASYLAPDCYGFAPRQMALTSQGFNLIQDTTGCDISGDTTGNITGQDPKLGLLANNGGPTRTQALAAGSPAIDAGHPAAPGDGGNACAVSDQRGLLRPLGTACDIGAFERLGTFSLSGVLPGGGGNSGLVLAQITGDGFANGATVKLSRAGEQDIVGAPVTVERGGSAITTTFDLTGTPTGAWDVVATNPDGAAAALGNSFVIEEGRAPELWVQIMGRNRIRSGRIAKYTILYGNRGNVDAVGVPLSLATPASYALASLFDITPPPPQAGQIATDWSLIPVHVSTDPQGGVINVPLLLPVVPAGFTGVLRIEFTVPLAASDELIVAAIGTPYFNPDLDPQIVDGIVAGAQSYAQGSLGVTLPPVLTPDLEQYAMDQLDAMIANGRTALVSSLGVPQVYSLSQLIIDLARFGAAQAPAGAQSGAIGNNARWLSAAYDALAFILSQLGPREANAGPCSGQVLAPGASCKDDKNPIPPPDDPKNPKPLTPAECRDLPNHQVSADGKYCVPKDKKGCPKIGANPVSGSDPGCAPFPLGPRDSIDPNDKVGVLGAAAEQFITGGTPLSYTIYFENLEIATAPAQEVVITDALDVATLDLDTLSLGPISFADITVIPLPGSSHYVGGVDLRPEQDLLVTIEADLDKSTGVLSWRFTSIDPATGQLTEDPDAGFLPPNINPPQGDGSVTFTVMPEQGLPSGASICNQASIVFDVNAPITTPEWCNVINDANPGCQIKTDYATAACAGTYSVSSIADLNAYMASDYGRSLSAKGKYMNLRIVKGLVAEQLDIKSPCKITVARGLTLDGNLVSLDGLKGVNIGNGLVVPNAALACLLSGQGTAKLGTGAVISGGALTVSASKTADLGKKAVVSLSGDLTVASEVGVASMNAETSLTATNANIRGKTVVIGKNASVTLSGNLHAEAADVRKCRINKTATLNAGAASGNCLD